MTLNFICAIPLSIKQKIKSHLIDFSQIKSLNFDGFTGRKKYFLLKRTTGNISLFHSILFLYSPISNDTDNLILYSAEGQNDYRVINCKWRGILPIISTYDWNNWVKAGMAILLKKAWSSKVWITKIDRCLLERC